MNTPSQTEPTPQGGGLLQSLKVFSATLLAITHTRLALLATELEEEGERLLSLLVIILVGLFCLGLGVLLLSLLLVVAYWDSHRLLVLGGLTAFFLASGAITGCIALRKLKTKPRVFAASLGELGKDQQQLTKS